MFALHYILCIILISCVEVMEWQELVFTFFIVLFTNKRTCCYKLYY